MGCRGFFCVLLHLSVSQQSWEELNLKRPTVVLTLIKEKAILQLAFSFPNAAALFSLCSVPTLRLCLTSSSAASASSSPSENQILRS